MPQIITEGVLNNLSRAKTDSKFLEDIKTLAVVCTQWGDTGKGKLVDYFSDWADIIARGTGGANAGHTIILKGREYIFHLIPSGILHPGKINIIGNGVALDPRAVIEELEILKATALDFGSLKIALNAKLVLPQHILIDRLRESRKDKIGTTGRGIGPVYEDYCRRISLFVNDLLNPEIFKEKFKKNLEDKLEILRSYDTETIKEIMKHPHLGEGNFFKEKDILDSDLVIAKYLEYGKELSPFISDTDDFIQKSTGKKRILLEGAQGNLLSIDFGTYPHVTSSDSSIQGLVKGVGMSLKEVDRCVGIVKSPFMTRVGEGPFPTELGGEKSRKWCAGKDVNRELELDRYPDLSMDLDPDSREFELGIAIRQKGKEYGATTKRPRRIGWLDLPLLRHYRQTAGFFGKEIALTKIDVMSQNPKIKICVEYRYEGPDYFLGDKLLKKGDIIKKAVPRSDVLRYCRPIYKEFSGWMSDISGIRKIEALPKALMDIVSFIEKEADVKVVIISVGPERDQTIFS